MPTLLACTDGSLYSASICDHAAWAALRLGVAVHALHLLEPAPASPAIDFSSTLGSDAAPGFSADFAGLEQTRARVALFQSETLLAAAHARLVQAGVSPSAIHTESRHGALVDAIADLSPAPDLIVIGKRGAHADFARGHLGSNFERVIRTSPAPVLVATRTFVPLTRALLAFDGGPSARRAVEHLADTGLLTGRSVRLVCVGDPAPGADDALASARARLLASGHRVESERLPGDADLVLPGLIARHDIQLLIMGAYGHSRLREFFVGSTTTALLRTCPVSALLYR